MFDDLTKITKKIENFFHKQPKFYFDRNPVRDWQMMLISFFVLILVIIGADAYIFYKIDKGDLFATPAAAIPQITTFDRNALDTENAFYNAQNITFTTIEQATTSPVIDPSL